MARINPHESLALYREHAPGVMVWQGFARHESTIGARVCKKASGVSLQVTMIQTLMKTTISASVIRRPLLRPRYPLGIAGPSGGSM